MELTMPAYEANADARADATFATYHVPDAHADDADDTLHRHLVRDECRGNPNGSRVYGDGNGTV